MTLSELAKKAEPKQIFQYKDYKCFFNEHMLLFRTYDRDAWCSIAPSRIMLITNEWVLTNEYMF